MLKEFPEYLISYISLIQFILCAEKEKGIIVMTEGSINIIAKLEGKKIKIRKSNKNIAELIKESLIEINNLEELELFLGYIGLLEGNYTFY